VTFYYWSYFLALALTRMLGRTVWFLDADAVRGLSSLAPHSSPPARTAGAGTFALSCGPAVSSNEREIYVIKSKETRLHEHVWKNLFTILSKKLMHFPKGTLDVAEERLLSCFDRAVSRLGTYWPSELRNAVNYRPGFAYDAVRKIRTLDGFAYLKNPSHFLIERIIDRMESNIATVSKPISIIQNPRTVSRILVDMTFLLHAITTGLHKELIERNGLDPRWRHNRTRFLKGEGVCNKDLLWPCEYA
jgi:hypothetical protein